MSVAFPTDQRSVDAWPRWIVDGSATKVEIDGFGGGGAGCSGGGGGGGGGGAGFFLHPAAMRNRANPNKMMLMFRLLILNLAS